MEETEIAYELLKFLIKNYKKNLEERFKFTAQEIDNIMLSSEKENIGIYEIMKKIGLKRGCLLSGGNVDEIKTSRIILDDFKNGKFGRITIEKIEN